jgi:hypothetical protein
MSDEFKRLHERENRMFDYTTHAHALRTTLEARLTETQARRLSLLFGLEGEPLSLRAAAAVEGMAGKHSYRRVQKTKEAALAKLRQNGELWVLWLLSGDVRGHNPDTTQEQDFHQPVHSNGASLRFGPDDVGVAVEAVQEALEAGGWHTMELRPGQDRWESDAYNRPDLMERYGDGWIAFHEGVKAQENPLGGAHGEAWQNGWLAARKQGFPAS